MLNKFYKIIIPIISKNYFNEKTGIKYKGKAYLIIEKSTNKLVFNTLLLDEQQEIWGKNGGRYGKEYGIKKYKDLFELREKSFSNKQSNSKIKFSSKFNCSIKKLNELILKNKLTIKSVDAFISGSNSSGGLKNPNADPIRIYYDNKEDLISNIYNKNNDKKEWKIFSLISNIDKKTKNEYLSEDLTMEILNEIEEKNIEYIFSEHINWNVIPYGMSKNEDIYLEFKRAFASNNIENIDNKNYSELLLLSEEEWKTRNPKEYIMSILDKENRDFISKQLRGNWYRIVNYDIKKNKYNKDFVDSLPHPYKEHILENKFVKNKILNSTIKKSEKENLLDKLFNKNNYILLTPTTHRYWDNDEIIIDKNGNIKNKKLDKNEFEKIFNKNKNIYSIYENTINEERKMLLKLRENIN